MEARLSWGSEMSVCGGGGVPGLALRKRPFATSTCRGFALPVDAAREDGFAAEPMEQDPDDRGKRKLRRHSMDPEYLAELKVHTLDRLKQGAREAFNERQHQNTRESSSYSHPTVPTPQHQNTTGPSSYPQPPAGGTLHSAQANGDPCVGQHGTEPAGTAHCHSMVVDSGMEWAPGVPDGPLQVPSLSATCQPAWQHGQAQLQAQDELLRRQLYQWGQAGVQPGPSLAPHHGETEAHPGSRRARQHGVFGLQGAAAAHHDRLLVQECAPTPAHSANQYLAYFSQPASAPAKRAEVPLLAAGRHAALSPSSAARPLSCLCGNRTGWPPGPDMKCNHCSRALCDDCLAFCDGCEQNYCKSCSLTNYDEPMDRTFCLDCLSKH